jgi:hypothetical protein
MADRDHARVENRARPCREHCKSILSLIMEFVFTGAIWVERCWGRGELLAPISQDRGGKK